MVLGDHTVVCALEVAGEGGKHVLGMREGNTENGGRCTAFFLR